MSRSRSIFLLILLAVLLPLPALACMWDHDTLEQERARFPDAIELITGKFLRHSTEFYEWRIKDRLRKLAVNPNNLSYYDDLAVAYQKTGRHEKAVDTMLAKDKLKPGLYETEANLGTFYVLSGNLNDGLLYIDKSLKTNPHAHFDRERYQKWLVEYALSREHEGQIIFPMRDCADYKDGGFADFLAQHLVKKEKNGRLPLLESQKAVQAVLGMMRFANYDNPLLLEALGDLLLATKDEDAKRLAASAYLSASYKFKGRPEESAYRQLAERAISMQLIDAMTTRQLDLSKLESVLSAEREEADYWYTNLQRHEHDWISQGLNADTEFDKLYRIDPLVFDKDAGALTGGLLFIPWSSWIAVLSCGLIVLLTLRCMERKNRNPPA